MGLRKKKQRARTFTLVEVVAATILLALAVVPILRTLTTAQATGTTAQRTTQSLFLAVEKIEYIQALALNSFSTDFSTTNEMISGQWLCTVQDGQESTDLKSIRVAVGFDSNNNGQLDSDEQDVTLATKIANLQ
jgi:cytochrome c oxidase assembly protein Cox11